MGLGIFTLHYSQMLITKTIIFHSFFCFFFPRRNIWAHGMDSSPLVRPRHLSISVPSKTQEARDHLPSFPSSIHDRKSNGQLLHLVTSPLSFGRLGSSLTKPRYFPRAQVSSSTAKTTSLLTFPLYSHASKRSLHTTVGVVVGVVQPTFDPWLQFLFYFHQCSCSCTPCFGL